MTISTQNNALQLPDEVEQFLQLKYDPVLYVASPAYTKAYGDKLIYYLIEVVNANPSITVNQVCSLLRNTLQIPEELTRTTLQGLCSTQSKIFKTHTDGNGIKHLTLGAEYFSIQKRLAMRYPELEMFVAPVYLKRKTPQEYIAGNVALADM